MSHGSDSELPVLVDGRVLIWTALLDGSTKPRLSYLAGLLSEEETRRASRFRFDQDRTRFVVCRGTLREILASYLKIEPQTVEFTYGEHGKPYCMAPTGRIVSPIRFNVSHSAHYAIFAVSTSEVGVDIEVIRPMPEMEALVERYFSVPERKAFYSVAPDLQLKAFLSCWTRKEAYVKARGDGLSNPLDQCNVSLAPSLPGRSVNAHGAPSDQLEWSLHSFDVFTDTVAALVCRRNCLPHFGGPWPAAVTPYKMESPPAKPQGPAGG